MYIISKKIAKIVKKHLTLLLRSLQAFLVLLLRLVESIRGKPRGEGLKSVMTCFQAGGEVHSKVQRMVTIALSFLAMSVVFSLLGSVSSEEHLQFFNEVHVSEGTRILKVSQLINDTKFTSINCLNINLTLNNLKNNTEILLDVYEKDLLRSLRISPGGKAVISLKPPYNAYTFVLEGERCPGLYVEADCLRITYPYRYLSVVSLIFFFMGTILLVNSLFRELPNSLRESDESKREIL
jgi:hypothetical protein